ncbi:DUF4197 domain-containing protein [Piscinibacterium candidicorallinum]|uniref:DUF4197 domain-containing protein n=1 Tax=Piscinibacterium candidicorallinum TaxID=1793872 RepID=A0ABV7H9K8_9BURK
MSQSVVIAGVLVLSVQAQALDLSRISNQDASAGLKEALNKGSAAAVAKLGVTDGFLKNPEVKIPLPDGLKQAERAAKLLGRQKDFDELVTGMNRAAEQAVPLAKPLLTDAIKSMSVDDAKKIISGGDDSVTQFFKSKTEKQLGIKFQPIVKQTTDKVGLANQYNKLAAQAQQFGMVKEQDAKIESYVTRKALDGLFLMIGKEERAIRQDPLKYGSEILKKVFAR